MPQELDDYYLCDDPVTGLSDTSGNPLIASPGGDIFNLSVMPYDDFIRIPPRVIWCILRAQRIHGTKPLEQIDEKVIKGLLDLACKYRPYIVG